MHHFKNILVVVNDKTDHDVVLGRAVTLSQRNQARLTVVNVIKDVLPTERMPVTAESLADVQGSGIKIIKELQRDTITSGPLADVQEPISDTAELSYKAHISAPSESAMSIREYIIEEGHCDLEQAVATLRQAGAQVSSKVLCGTPFLEIIREVLRNEHDLVMIAAEGQDRLKEMLFGSTTTHLMRKCPCPVWVMKPNQSLPYNQVMAAVDPIPFEKERNALNTKIMELATSLAQLERSELHIIHTWTLYGEAVLRGWRGRFKIPACEVDRLVRKTRDEHKVWLDEFLQKHALDNLTCRVHLLKGDAGTLISELAEEKKIELIVMGMTYRTGMTSLFIGSTAENVLRRANCSVLTVKPDGFVTPVRLDE